MSVTHSSEGLGTNPIGKRVLVADDSTITQDLLKLVLTQRGHQVDIVDDGIKALKALKRNTYEVALLDIHMPKMDGVQVVSSYLSENHSGKTPRFVAITADVEGLLAHNENCESFDHIVPKPIDIHGICNVVEEAPSSLGGALHISSTSGVSAAAPVFLGLLVCVFVWSTLATQIIFGGAMFDHWFTASLTSIAVAGIMSFARQGYRLMVGMVLSPALIASAWLAGSYFLGSNPRISFTLSSFQNGMDGLLVPILLTGSSIGGICYVGSEMVRVFIRRSSIFTSAVFGIAACYQAYNYFAQ
ncbi:MAG: response regulator [Rhizobiales bacterium]|nr:response regulator [Hyphomicrobiales bacterium]